MKWERRGPAHGGARGQPEREQGERGGGDSEKGAVRNLPSEGRVEDSLRPDPRQGGASDQCLAEGGEGPVAAEIRDPDHRGIIALRRPPKCALGFPVLLALLLAAAPSPLLADPDLAEAMGRIDPRPGAWVEYLVRAPGRDDLRVRATVLPAATGGRHWIELITASADGIVSASRLLLRADELFPRSVERMYLMLAGQQPIEVPMDRIELPEARIHARPPVARLGTRRVRVPAGTFAAEAMRIAGTRVWRTATVPLWGLVKARSSRQSMELVSFGTSGGHSVFPPGWDQGKGSDSARQ